MQRTKHLIFLLVAASIAFGFAAYALIENPPTEQTHEHEEQPAEEQQTTQQQPVEEQEYIEQVFTDIDPSVSKTLVLKVEEMDNRTPADEIASTLLEHEGLIGKVTSDMKQRIFTIEYDSSKLKVEDLMNTVNLARYKTEKVSDEATPSP